MHHTFLVSLWAGYQFFIETAWGSSPWTRPETGARILIAAGRDHLVTPYAIMPRSRCEVWRFLKRPSGGDVVFFLDGTRLEICYTCNFPSLDFPMVGLELSEMLGKDTEDEADWTFTWFPRLSKLSSLRVWLNVQFATARWHVYCQLPQTEKIGTLSLLILGKRLLPSQWPHWSLECSITRWSLKLSRKS